MFFGTNIDNQSYFYSWRKLDLILESEVFDFVQRTYLKLLMHSYILIYLLCSSVLQWIFLIVLVLQNLFEFEDHQETGWYMRFISKLFLKETQFCQSEQKSTTLASHPTSILLYRRWGPELFRLNAIISLLFLTYWIILKVIDLYIWKWLLKV